MGIGSHKKSKLLLEQDQLNNNSSTISSSDVEKPSIEYLPNGVTLVWLDQYAGKTCSEDESNILSHLRQLNVAFIYCCNDVQSCLNFIKSVSLGKNIRYSKIFLIVSGVFSLQILPEIRSFPIIDSIFIFCMNQPKYLPLIDEYNSLSIDICTEVNVLCDCIKQQSKEFDQSTLVFHFFAQAQNTTRNLTKDAASFMGLQLFLIIISDLKCSQNEMNVMLDYCSKQAQHNIKQKQMLFQIEEFRRNYKSQDAIFWYTKESFVYHLLNRALRTEDFEALYIFRFFLADLCRQLKVEHEKLCQNQLQSPILTLYRGGHISREELDDLKKTVDNITSLNGFISTSLKQEIAMDFIKKQQTNRKNLENILFIITVDTRLKSIICGYVGELSAMEEEEEVLLNMGTAFHLEKIIFDCELKIWNVYMKATDAGIKAAHDYIALVNNELGDTNVSIIFGQLFLQMGQYPVGQKYFFDLTGNIPKNDPIYPSVLYHLALTYSYQHDLKQAENLLNEAFHVRISLKSNNLDLARTKNALGWIYHHSGELAQAITYYKEALTIAEGSLYSHHLIHAQTYSLLGDCYLEKRDFRQAQEFYQKALEIEQKRLPSDHPRIGDTLNDLGNVFRKCEYMENALEKYKRAETIFHRKLPRYHPCTAYCWSCMAFVYLYNGQIDKAQEYHKQALEIYRRVLPPDHINIQISEKNSHCTDFRKINDTYLRVCAHV